MASILVIEDDSIIRNMILAILEKTGHQIQACEDGDLGLQIADKIKPDLVLTDILMPNKDGIEVIESLKQAHPDIKIIAMSGGGFNRKEYYLKIAEALGSDNIISKPFKPDELIHAIEKLLKNP